MDALVFDTSAILNFGHRDDLQPLLARFGALHRLFTTPEVVAELTDPARKPFYDSLLRTHFTVCAARSVALDLATMARLAVAIDPGEISVIALAHEMKAIAVIDERLARRKAATLGVRLTGTIGLLHDALQKGWHTDAESLAKIHLLTASGFRIRRPGANETFTEYFASLQ